MNRNSRNRLKLAQKAKKNGQRVSTFPRPAPYKEIVLSLCKTEPIDKFPKVARKRRNANTD